jgi:AraC family transcriptional regulator of adaptative response/methylated-DNA-[protein]-cysteine methyltransferase
MTTLALHEVRHELLNEGETRPAVDREHCWNAVLNRDADADGSFVYAVRSTRIYCRPSCPSRRPLRRHVLFFPRPEAAEAAGFRACLRCRPREATRRDRQLAMVERACREIERRTDGTVSLDALARSEGVSAHQLVRSFKRIMGITPRQYVEACRVARFKSLLREGDAVTSAMYDVGLSSTSRLYERAPSELGMTPAVYRRGGRGARIAYTITGSPLGRLLVAATDRGICAVSLGDDDALLERELAREYPAAQLTRDDGALAVWVSAIVRHLNGKQPHLDLPLDVQATAFQRRVWQALRDIPYGTTRSYSAIARSLGRPTATRAVARACATNPVSLVIPCHRAVRQDGSLGGYRWGLERKRALLTTEAERGSGGR